MKIAIEEILTAMDMATAKALGRQQLNLKYASLNLSAKEPGDKTLLRISGSTLIIAPEIVQANDASVEMKISIRQRAVGGETSPLLTAQLNFIRMPVRAFFPGEQVEDIAVFTTLSLN